MSQQSSPTLSLCLAFASVIVPSCMLHAQPFRSVLDGPTDPTASSNSSPSNPAATSFNDDGLLPLPGTSATTATTQTRFSLVVLNGVLEKYRQVGNREAEAHTLGAIASSYNALRQQQKAVEIYQAELNLWRALGEKKGEATTLAHIGDVYREWGFPDRATRFYRDALKVSPDKSEEAAIMNNLGLAYFALRDKKKCLEFLNQSLASYRAIQDRQGEAHTLTNLASIYGFMLNDPHKAIDYFQQALTKLELIDDRPTEASALELMGSVWLKLQKQDMAVQSFQRALFLYDRIGNAKGEASVRKQLSKVSDTGAIAAAR